MGDWKGPLAPAGAGRTHRVGHSAGRTPGKQNVTGAGEGGAVSIDRRTLGRLLLKTISTPAPGGPLELGSRPFHLC